MGKRKVGLALSGGGARGYAHIGVIRVLQRYRVPIDIVAGTSMGAVIGSALACGIDLYKLEKILLNLNLNKLLGIPDSTFREIGGLAGRITSEYLFKRTDWRNLESENTRNLYQFFTIFARDKNFADLPIQFATVAVDIDTGEEVVIRAGKVYKAIVASMAMPGIHYPVKLGERFLVDGGIVNNLPVDVVINMGADIVIAVDVTTPLAERVKTSVDVLSQAGSITSRELTRVKTEAVRERLKGRLILLKPAVEKINMLSLSQVESAVKAGEEEAQRHVERIKELLRHFEVVPPC